MVEFALSSSIQSARIAPVHSLTFASSAPSIDLRRPDQRNHLRDVGHYLSLSAWQIEPVPEYMLRTAKWRSPCTYCGIVEALTDLIYEQADLDRSNRSGDRWVGCWHHPDLSAGAFRRH